MVRPHIGFKFAYKLDSYFEWPIPNKTTAPHIGLNIHLVAKHWEERGANHCHGIGLSKRNTMNQDKFYFRYVEQEEKIDISFLFKIKESVRQFNLSRNPNETVQVLFTRIEANIKKVINKVNKKSKKAEVADMGIQLFNVDNPLPAECTCKDLFSLKGPIKLKIFDSVYEAVFNAPWVISISLPQSVLAGFPVYPEHFQVHYADKSKSIYNWYCGLGVNEKGNTVSEDHIKWDQVGTGYTYTPSTQDVGKKLKLECIPSDGVNTGPAVETVSKNAIEAGPGCCPFETRHMFTTTKLKDKSFRCVSYNILADLYCDSDYTRTVLHPYCPPYALHIDYRKQLILKELIGYNGDIICLQEVDTKIFHHTLVPFLKFQGLAGLFFKKGKEVAEGLSCFFRSDRFRSIGQDHIVLSAALKEKACLEPIWNKIKDNTPLVERVLDRSTVASATFLQSLDNERDIVVVGNTHLYFHPDADHIRLLQGGVVIYWLMDVIQNLQKQQPDKRISLILCGDFNSVPSCGIYQLYTTGVAPNDLPDWSSNANEAVKELTLQQNIPLASACGTPEYTNFTNGFADCLDYIYYDKSNLTVEQVVPFPSVEELKLHTALPSIVFPSDHIALISDLRFTN